MTPRQKIRWEKVKAKGKRRFVLEHAFAFASGVALSESVHKVFWKNSPPLEVLHIFDQAALTFAFIAFCSALGALWYWERNEKNESNHNGAMQQMADINTTKGS